MPRRNPRTLSGACISMQVIEYVPNQTARRGRAIRAWFVETVAKQVRHADCLLKPEQLREPFELVSASLGVAEVR